MRIDNCHQLFELGSSNLYQLLNGLLVIRQGDEWTVWQWYAHSGYTRVGSVQHLPTDAIVVMTII